MCDKSIVEARSHSSSTASHCMQPFGLSSNKHGGNLLTLDTCFGITLATVQLEKLHFSPLVAGLYPVWPKGSLPKQGLYPTRVFTQQGLYPTWVVIQVGLYPAGLYPNRVFTQRGYLP